MWAEGKKHWETSVARHALLMPFVSYDAHMITSTHISEWLMSSNVEEAVRYLKQEQNVHKLERNYPVLRQKPSHVISGLSTVMQPSHSKTMPGKWCPTGEAGREWCTDLSVRQTLLLFHKKVIMSTRQSKWNMLLTGTRSGPHASLWTGSVWCYWEDSYPAAVWYLLHISPWPKAPVAKSEFHPPSVWDKKNIKA